MTTPIVLLSGMDRTYPVFARLQPLLPASDRLPFVDPLRGESFDDYCERFASGIPTGSVIIGVSFGGIVANRIASLVNARACVLIASIPSLEEIPPWFRIGRHAGRSIDRILSISGHVAAAVPSSHRTKSTMRAAKLSGERGRWHRWAVSALLQSRPHDSANRPPTLHIHGNRDRVFPLRYTDPDVVIPGAGHDIAVTHADQVANYVRGFLNETLGAGLITLNEREDESSPCNR